jgi:hypothetical protein
MKQGYDRSRQAYPQRLPSVSVLPGDDGLSTIFLSAQAANAIEGMKDLRILNQRNASHSKFSSTGLCTYQDRTWYKEYCSQKPDLH